MKKKHRAKMVLKRRPTRAVRVRTHKFVAGLMSAIVPGLGHLYLRLYLRGLTYMMLVMLDLSALVYFSSVGIQINVPLLILLALFIPVLYFYNVFDVLQSADRVMLRKRKGNATPDLDQAGSKERTAVEALMMWEKGISFGLLLVVGGALMVMFFRRPRWFQDLIGMYGGYAFAVLMIVTGLNLLGREIWTTLQRKKM